MQLYMKSVFFTALTALTLIGCVEKAKISLPKAETKLVVNCFISPGDSVVMATVRLSQPKWQYSVNIGALVDDISDARVIITDGTVSDTLTYISQLHFYSTGINAITIQEGKSYSLTVTTPDGKQVSASTSVPVGKFGIESYKVTIIRNKPSLLEYSTELIVNDIPGASSYLAVYEKNILAIKNDTSKFFNDTSSISGGYYPHFENDENIARSRFVYSNQVRYDIGGDTILFSRHYIEVLNCSREFYLYHSSLTRAIESSGNPFADPVMMYSNFNNGFGCFGAFSKTIVDRRIRP